MKLVFLSHVSDCSGGAQKCLLDLLKGLKQSHPDWKIYMIFPSSGELVDACSVYLDGYTFLRMRWWFTDADNRVTLWDKFVYMRRLLKYSIKLASYLRRIKPDFGITNTIMLPHLALACKLLRIKHCWFIHEIPDLTWRNLKPLFKYQSIFKAVNGLSIKVLVTSECARKHYQNVMPEFKVSAITQAVELPLATVSNMQDARERYSILLVGAFDSNKGHLELLQAVKMIVAGGRDVFCYLVGPDAGLKSMCQDYVRDNGLGGNVNIVPYTNQISLYYSLADVLLVCSAFETFGRVAVEAQKYGLPVILSNVGANPERIEDGVNGLLYQKGDVTDLVAKIEILRDAATRKAFSKNIDSAMLNERYSIDNFASNFCNLLRL